MARILLVEDSLPSQRVAVAALAPPDFEVHCAASMIEARRAADGDVKFDLVLLDIGLPDGEGLELLREWRLPDNRLASVPICLLTGKEDLDSKLKAFSLGAEDYLIKPINPRELKGHVELRLRKSHEAKAPNDTLRRGRLTLNFPLMRATISEDSGDVAIELTTKEFRLVATLAQREGQILSRAELVNEVWGNNTHVVNRTVDSHICGARRKMGLAGSYIQSVTGSGYRFIVKD